MFAMLPSDSCFTRAATGTTARQPDRPNCDRTYLSSVVISQHVIRSDAAAAAAVPGDRQPDTLGTVDVCDDAVVTDCDSAVANTCRAVKRVGTSSDAGGYDQALSIGMHVVHE